MRMEKYINIYYFSKKKYFTFAVQMGALASIRATPCQKLVQKDMRGNH